MTFTIVDSISKPRSGSFTFDPLSPFGPSTSAAQSPYHGSQFKPLRLGTHPWVRAYVRDAPADGQSLPRLSFLTQYAYMYGTDAFTDSDGAASPSFHDRVNDSALDLDDREGSSESDSDDSDDGIETPRHGTLRPNTPHHETVNDDLLASEIISITPVIETQSKPEPKGEDIASTKHTAPIRLRLSTVSRPNPPLQPPFKVEIRSGITTIRKSTSSPSPPPLSLLPSTSSSTSSPTTPSSISRGSMSPSSPSSTTPSPATHKSRRRPGNYEKLPEIELNVSTIGGLFSNPLTYAEGVFGHVENTSQRRGELRKAYIPPDWRKPAG
ncbi:hypothetical protein M422DRAFT_775631 [Sphaerobolus stellatus SS14]|nr:hypothetical protein M422DRAFT_775631 [Sphaerobolus stellatus SS14]